MKIRKILYLIGAINFLFTLAVLFIAIVVTGEKQLISLPDKFVPLFAFFIGGLVSLIASSFND